MLRKTFITLAAAATLGVGALASSPASAHWGHFGGFGHFGGYHRAFFHPVFVGHPFFYRRHFAFIGGPLYLDSGYGCWRVRRVPTFWGWRWRRIWVCG